MQLNKLELAKQVELAERYLKDKNDAKAAKVLKKIVDEDPSNDEAWLLLGIAKRRLKEYDDAIECFKVATEFNPSMEEGWGLLTVTYVDHGKIKMAKESIEKAAQLNPHNDKIQFYRDNLIDVYKKHGPFF